MHSFDDGGDGGDVDGCDGGCVGHVVGGFGRGIGGIEDRYIGLRDVEFGEDGLGGWGVGGDGGERLGVHGGWMDTSML